MMYTSMEVHEAACFGLTLKIDGAGRLLQTALWTDNERKDMQIEYLVANKWKFVYTFLYVHTKKM